MSNSCQYNPYKLKLATTDPTLYNVQQDTWDWNGTMYWAVECLPDSQTSTPQDVIPNIEHSKYQQLLKTPSDYWNFCGSACSSSSESLLVVLTFNPTSSSAADYLQFVLDIDCAVTDRPTHGIADQQGKIQYIDISKVERHFESTVVELWLSRGLTHTGSKGEDTDLYVIKTWDWKLIAGIAAGAAAIIIIAIIIIVAIVRGRKKRRLQYRAFDPVAMIQ